MASGALTSAQQYGRFEDLRQPSTRPPPVFAPREARTQTNLDGDKPPQLRVNSSGMSGT